MIRYTLKCDQEHRFDSWFQSAHAFERLSGGQMINCSICGSGKVEKAIMSPGVTPARNAAKPTPNEPGRANLSEPASAAEQALAMLRAKIMATSEDVGRDFAREARAIHEGESPERAIIGEAAPHEARALLEDGIPVAPLPWYVRRSN
ncbi:MAG: DUF1178 family protein [Rhodobacteraceae bacterium]|nr:DUF1178 family protein [Paracoccaceae bacterium]